MLNFASDYVAGAHPVVMERLVQTNLENLSGYGTDEYCNMAKNKIKEACGSNDAEVFFLVGGTQTNQIIISSILKSYEGVIAADTGHVSIHEAGAIEYTGHKVLQIEGHNGKLSADSLSDYIEKFYSDDNHEHMVFPGMVYISFPTEYGTLYSKKELSDIYEVCRKNKLPLFVDGARLGYGLASRENDMTLSDLCSLCDVFYIGGTKVGALCGEAVVFTNKDNMPVHFMTIVKQHGALLAKGRLLGVQFDALFTNDLYFKISEHAINMAYKLRDIFTAKGYKFYLDSPTNQQFIILENSKMNMLSKNVVFSFWEAIDDRHTVVRFATSWSTTEDDLNQLEKYL